MAGDALERRAGQQLCRSVDPADGVGAVLQPGAPTGFHRRHPVTQYAEAVSTGNSELQTFDEERLFRLDFMPALNAWVVADPVNNPDAPRNPFVDSAYLNTLFAESEALEQQATDTFQAAEDANQIGDDYVLNTVFYASVLFFAAVASKSDHRVVQRGLLLFALLIFVIVTARIVGMPIQ